MLKISCVCPYTVAKHEYISNLFFVILKSMVLGLHIGLGQIDGFGCLQVGRFRAVSGSFPRYYSLKSQNQLYEGWSVKVP